MCVSSVKKRPTESTTPFFGTTRVFRSSGRFLKECRPVGKLPGISLVLSQEGCLTLPSYGQAFFV